MEMGSCIRYYPTISEKAFYIMRKGRAEQRVTDKLSIGKYGVWIEFCLSEDDFFGKKKKVIQFYIYQDY